MNVYDKAHELAKALSSCHEYKDYKDAKGKIENDKQNSKMLKDFKKRQFQLQSAYLAGKQPSEEEIEQLRKLSELLQHSPDLSAYMQAEYRFNQLMSDIYKILGDAIDLNFDFLDEE